MSQSDATIEETQIESPNSGPRSGWLGSLRRLFTPDARPTSNIAPVDPGPLDDGNSRSFVVAPGGYRIRLPDNEDMHQGIRQMLPSVLDGLKIIPPLPQLVIELLKEIQNPNASAASVGNIAAADPALAASLLRTVNSAAFGLHRKITNVADAVNYLGFASVKTMVLQLQLDQALGGHTAVNPDLADLWVHSLIVSYIADCIGRRVPGVDRGFVSTLGLLHDIGKIVVLTRFPDQARELTAARAADPASSTLAQETKILGVNHADLGANVAAQWGLPGDLVRAIRFHHVPQKAFEPTDPKPLHQAMYVLQLANQLAKYCYVYCDEPEIDAVEDPAFEALGFPVDLTALLDQAVRTAASRAIFFAQDETTQASLAVRRFLQLHRGEAAAKLLAAQQGASAATQVRMDDAMCDFMFDRLAIADQPGQAHRRLRASGAASVSGLQTLAADMRKNQAKLELAAEANLPLAMVAHCVLANVPHERGQRVDVVHVLDSGRVSLAIRAEGLRFANRFASSDQPATLAALDSELANVLNLKWFDSIVTSTDGGTLIFTVAAG